MQFIKSVLDFVLPNFKSLLGSAAVEKKLEKELMAICTDKQNASRQLFFYKFQDYIYNKATTITSVMMDKKKSCICHYNPIIALCLHPLLDHVANKLRQTVHLQMRLYYEQVYEELAFRLNIAMDEYEREKEPPKAAGRLTETRAAML